MVFGNTLEVGSLEAELSIFMDPTESVSWKSSRSGICSRSGSTTGRNRVVLCLVVVVVAVISLQQRTKQWI